MTNQMQQRNYWLNVRLIARQARRMVEQNVYSDVCEASVELIEKSVWVKEKSELVALFSDNKGSAFWAMYGDVMNCKTIG